MNADSCIPQFLKIQGNRKLAGFSFFPQRTISYICITYTTGQVVLCSFQVSHFNRDTEKLEHIHTRTK